MAKRRMLSIPIVETDKFYNLTAAAQALYVHLNLNADDDGVVDRVKLITNQMRIKRKCYEELLLGGYIIELEEGLIAITHWHQHNQIRKERYVKGEYYDRLSSLSLQENGRFIKASESVLGDKCAPQDSIGKDSTVEYSKAEDRVAKHRAEEKKEEKNNSISLSYLHSEVASLPESKNVENSSSDQNMQTALKTLIKLYFMKKYNVEYSDEFIDFCNTVGWKIGGEPIIIRNYKAIIDEWMTKK